MIKLTQYLVAAILTWSPARNHPDETPLDYELRVREIADDIAAVTRSEPSPFEDDSEKVKSAVLLASLAFWESNFQIWVDDGTCTSAEKMRAWVAHHFTGWNGACDGTIAVSMWQIHPELGFVLIPDGGWRWRTSSDTEQDVWTRRDLLHSRRAAARVALHLARQSLKNGAGLAQYTGELGPTPKAAVRLEFARRYWREHPVTADMLTD
jgi:hypothetical protein